DGIRDATVTGVQTCASDLASSTPPAVNPARSARPEYWPFTGPDWPPAYQAARQAASYWDRCRSHCRAFGFNFPVTATALSRRSKIGRAPLRERGDVAGAGE